MSNPTVQKLVTLLACSLLFLGFPKAQAEPEFNFDVWKGVKGYYYPGFSFLNTSSLNQTLAENNFSNYSGTFLNQAGGAHVILDRIILGGSGHGLIGFRAASAKGDTIAVDGGYGLLNLGYLLISNKGFNLYPTLGIGSGIMTISSSTALNKLFKFESTEDIFRLNSSQIILDLGISADYMIDFNTDPQHASGILVGLRLGFVFVPSPTQWESNRRVFGGTTLPNLSSQGIYINLMLGGGTVREN